MLVLYTVLFCLNLDHSINCLSTGFHALWLVAWCLLGWCLHCVFSNDIYYVEPLCRRFELSECFLVGWCVQWLLDAVDYWETVRTRPGVISQTVEPFVGTLLWGRDLSHWPLPRQRDGSEPNGTEVGTVLSTSLLTLNSCVFVLHSKLVICQSSSFHLYTVTTPATAWWHRVSLPLPVSVSHLPSPCFISRWLSG